MIAVVLCKQVNKLLITSFQLVPDLLNNTGLDSFKQLVK